MTENQRKILVFLREHPHARTAEIAQHLGVPNISAYHTLKPLVDRGLLTRVVGDAVDRHGGRHTYKLAPKRRETKEVLAWSRKIGHPFGILAAQVMA